MAIFFVLTVEVSYLWVMAMAANQLPLEIRQKNSFLCLGLDPDTDKMPEAFPKSPEGMLQFCLEIAEAIQPLAVSAKVNTAFFERWGSAGWAAMEQLFSALNQMGYFTIADAKRADIGNTAAQYAEAIFGKLNADAITLSPYMGCDSIQPFLDWENKTAILLALTSNPGHADFEMLELKNGKRLFEQVIETSQKWSRKGDLMYVVGATRASELATIRKLCPDHFLLVPGVGAQGGSLQEVAHFGLNKDIGLIVNASRSILYASSAPDYREKAFDEAKRIQQEMEFYIWTK